MAFIRNVGRVAENVKVVLKNGATAWVRVMPRHKGVTLGDDVESVDEAWAVQFGDNIRHFDADVDAQTTVVSSGTPRVVANAFLNRGKGSNQTTTDTQSIPGRNPVRSMVPRVAKR